MRRPLLFLGLAGLVAIAPAAAAAPDASPSFEGFAGRWMCVGHFASGKHIASRMSFESALQGAGMVKRHDDVAPGGYHAVEVWGAASKRGGFDMVVLDTFGGARHFVSDGWHGATLVWTGDAQVVPAQRFVYSRLDATHFRVDWQLSRDHQPFTMGDTLTCTRQP
ncbi:MAG: hypothetical protein AB1832_17890 [Pseudomonadota bacterium]